MKTKFFFLLSFLLVFTMTSATAQRLFNDTILFKAAIFTGETGKFLDAKQGFTMQKASLKLTKISPAQAKKFQVPPPTKTGKGPIVLKFGGDCYQFGCAKGDGCDNCRMAWWDRNKDGKIQPRRELRCFCPETRTQCQIRVRKVKCQ